MDLKREPGKKDAEKQIAKQIIGGEMINCLPDVIDRSGAVV